MNFAVVGVEVVLERAEVAWSKTERRVSRVWRKTSRSERESPLTYGSLVLFPKPKSKVIRRYEVTELAREVVTSKLE